MKIAVLPGDGIGTEIVAEAVKVLNVLDLKFEMERRCRRRRLRGQRPSAARGHAQAGQGIRRGAVRCRRRLEVRQARTPLRPEQAILGLRKNLGLFANFRPAICYEQLVHASSLKPELVSGLDILIIRELTGDIYFGQPRGRRTAVDGHFPGAEEAFDTMRYSRPEVERIAHVAFQAARKRSKRVTSVDKANVLETFQFWKDIVTEIGKEYPDVELDHMYVDNAAMQLVKAPKKFDVVVTGNMFGDILSDEAAMLTGSIGMLPSASLNASNQGLYEPSHGSAPDIAGKGVANPLATILSAAMMLRFSLNQPEAADRIESAVKHVLASGLRTATSGRKAPRRSAPAKWATRSWPQSPKRPLPRLTAARFVTPLPWLDEPGARKDQLFSFS
jgi:3-isopropylmalate dehydrogenase